MNKYVYADNAATTQLCSEAFDVMQPWLKDQFGNASQPYSFSRAPKNALSEARRVIAKAINAEPDEIFITSGGSESDNWAIKCSGNINRKRRIITTSIEHHAILHACNSCEKKGDTVVYLSPDEKGVISAKQLESEMTDDTDMVSVMFSNNEIGTIEPIQDLANIAHKQGALFHTDAVQAVGHVKIDVKNLGVDLLSASAHKFNGPKGIGFLYIRKGIPIVPYIDGGAQEFGYRAGTENIASIVGMAKALDVNIRKIEENEAYINSLERLLIEQLDQTSIDFIRNGSINHVPGNISLSFKNKEGEAILHRLDLMGICVSTGSACDSKDTQISHVLQAINLPREYALGTIRISLGKNNTRDDVLAIVTALKRVMA